jgi:hypothetical protein
MVHHSGKDASRGARGSSSLKGAVDLEIELTREKELGLGHPGTIFISKVRDGVDSITYGYTMVQLVLGIDADGDEVTTVAIDVAKPPARSGSGRSVSLGPKGEMFTQIHEELDPENEGLDIDALIREAKTRVDAQEFPEVKTGLPPSQYKHDIKRKLVANHGWSYDELTGKVMRNE